MKQSLYKIIVLPDDGPVKPEMYRSYGFYGIDVNRLQLYASVRLHYSN